MKIVTAAEMKSLDRRASSEYKIPSLLLMENAARGLVDKLEDVCGSSAGKRVVIVAGRGNNGGDGLAAARHLRMRGAEVIVYLFSTFESVRGDARTSLEIWKETGGTLFVEGAFSSEQVAADLVSGDLVMDALLGTGLSHPVTGRYAEAITLINRHAQTVVSVDIPSGISADTGEVLGEAVKANHTFTMALPKWGHFLRSGLEHRGDLERVDIGIPPMLIEGADIKVDLIGPSVLRGILPARQKSTHKGKMGHLLVLAGSVGKRGAAQMTSLAALRCGTGLVTTALPKSLEDSNPFPTMETMSLGLPESAEGTVSLSAEKMLYNALVGKSALAIGPGLSQNIETSQLVKNLISQIALPMVIDADGINALARDLSVLKRKQAALILTPHPGEMGRLIGKQAADIQKDRFNIARQFAMKWEVILVLKGAHTIIAAPDGSLRVNNTGNPGMASAGIGDALTGIVAGLLAQGIEPIGAATLGVALHGSAGDLAAASQGNTGLLSSDLIGKIPEAITEYQRRTSH